VTLLLDPDDLRSTIWRAPENPSCASALERFPAQAIVAIMAGMAKRIRFTQGNPVPSRSCKSSSMWFSAWRSSPAGQITHLIDFAVQPLL
jgi:hypothetical protein